MLWIILLFIIETPTCFADASRVIFKEKDPEPEFISQSEKYKFVAGDTILLPCDVANAGSYVIAWKRGIAILTAGTVKVSPDTRMSLENGYYLQIKNAVPQDAGDYTCQIATLEPMEIKHTVEILVPSRIHYITSAGHLQVKKGSSVRLECLATGNPTPNITWTRKNNILPDGEQKIISTVLTIENMDRHKGGTYICTAFNGVGQPASSQIFLHVLYAPEITAERDIVYSGEGQEAMLVCIVHGEAQPEVIWYKHTMQLDTTERHIMENRGAKHTLLIRKVHYHDFGNYTCSAENQLGKAKKIILLTGKPKTVIFHSPIMSQWGDRYNISWAVDSHAPVEEFKLSFRRLPKVHTNTEDSSGLHNGYKDQALQQQPQQQQQQQQPPPPQNQQQQYLRRGYYKRENATHHMSSTHYGPYLYQKGYWNMAEWSEENWRDVILPSIPLSHLYTQSMSYVIQGLEPNRKYEARVQARNRYGWSDLSDQFIFSTPNANAYKERKMNSMYSIKASSSNNYLAKEIIILFIIILILRLS